MASNLKTAYDAIHAGERLKANTLAFLRQERSGASRPARQRHTRTKRLTAVLASLVLLAVTGLFTAHAFFTPVSYVDLDINPSVGLLLNRFDRVIGLYAYNPDGEALLSGLPLQYKDCEAAILLLMDEMNGQGYLSGGGLLSVTLQTDAAERETRLLTALRAETEEYMTSRRCTAQTEIFPVSSDARSDALVLNLSPAKYLAIQALIAVDPAATVEGCRHHSIDELHARTNHHTGHHAAAPESPAGQLQSSSHPQESGDFRPAHSRGSMGKHG